MKKFKERLTALMLTISMVLSLNVSIMAEEKQSFDKALGFFEHICAVNDVTFNPDKNVTRQEFAAILVNLLNLKNSQNEEIEIPFEDVDEESSYIDEIELIVDNGYMNGISDTYFAPENDLILIQAVKVFVDLLGYRTVVLHSGGYPDGYQAISDSIELTKGIAKSYTDTITQRDLAKLIYNALDTSMLMVDMSTGPLNLEMNGEDTFLTTVLNLRRVTGILTDNGITTMYAKTVLAPDQIKIDNLTISFPESEQYVQDYIGRNVTAYVTDDDDPRLVYAHLSGRDSVVSFDIEDFESYTSSAITYNNGTKSVTRVLSDNAVMIYNGMAEEYFDESTFNFENGKVTLVSYGADVELILVEKIDYIHIGAIDAVNQKIYSSLLGSNRVGETIDISTYDYVSIKSAACESISLNDLRIGNVIKVLRNDSVIRVTMFDGIVENFVVRKTWVDNGKTYISDGNAEYRLLQEYMNSPYSIKPEMGNAYKISLGDDAIAVHLEAGAGDTKVAYLISTKFNEDDETYFIKVYGTDGKMAKFTLDEKVNVLDTSGNEGRYADSYLYTDVLYGLQGLIKYKVNNDGLVNYIECPTEDPNTDGQLYELYDSSEVSDINGDNVINNDDKYVWTGDSGFQGVWFYDNDTVFMSIPNDKGNEREFKNLTLAEAVNMYDASRRRPTIAYATEPNAMVADYVLFLQESIEAALVGSTKTYFVVEQVTEEWMDDETVSVIEGTVIKYEQGTKKRMTLYSKPDAVVEPDGSTHSAFVDVTDSLQTPDSNGDYIRYDIQKGDIIRVIYDEKGFVSIADLVWRMTMDNPTSANGKKGWLVGSNGYNRAGTDGNRGNPYSVENNGYLQPYSPKFHANHSYRVTYGSVIKTEGKGFVQYTSADLTDPAFTPDNIPNGFFKYNVNVSGMIVMEIDGNKVTSRPATINDIKSYEQAGRDCSRILIANYHGVETIGVIINGGSY